MVYARGLQNRESGFESRLPRLNRIGLRIFRTGGFGDRSAEPTLLRP
jgi:hypothetical protein